ncbi:hypothetical protein FSOLCH5_014076 [Fusarium solani]
MARTAQRGRGGRGRGRRFPPIPRHFPPPPPLPPPRAAKPPRPPRDGELQYMVLKQEAERRERILADRRRVASKWRPKIPQVRKVNFENFKNRFQDVDEPDYAIDVLMGGPTTQAQIRREHGQRRREEIARLRQSYLSLKNNGSGSSQNKIDAYEKARRERKGDALQSSENEIQRIRIQSQPVLGHLTALMNDTDQRSTPRTFMRPFKALVHFQPKMKEILATLEEKWADFEELDSDQSEAVELSAGEEVDIEPEVLEAEDMGSVKGEGEEEDDGADTESLESVDSNADEDFEGLMDSPEALRDMRCYVEFIDNEILPLHSRFDGTGAEKVKFDDLWSLFRVGDLIYMPASGETGGRYHEVWRIYKTRAPDPRDVVSHYWMGFFRG